MRQHDLGVMYLMAFVAALLVTLLLAGCASPAEPEEPGCVLFAGPCEVEGLPLEWESTCKPGLFITLPDGSRVWCDPKPRG
jgi:hypothetical protein